MDKKTYRLNKLFSENFNTMGNVKSKTPLATNPKSPTNVGKKKPPIVQHTKFTDDNMSESDFSALVRKSQSSGIDLEILGEVFDRGIGAWTSDTNNTPQQYAFNRVNSFINEGRAFREDDADLAEMCKNRKKKIVSEGGVMSFGKKKPFRNWTFDLKPGQRTKVLTGDHRGKRGVVLGRIEQPDGPVFRIKHDDGTVLKHHISTLDEPDDPRKTGFGVRRVSEDVEELKHAPSIESIAKKHKVDVKTLADDLANGTKIEMEHTKDREVAEKIALHHLEERPDYYVKLRQYVESKNTPYVKPHYGDGSNPKRQTAWKASNKHGKVKYFGLDFKSAAIKHAGVMEESMTHEELIKEMEKYKKVMDRFGGKLMFTTRKHKGEQVQGYVTGHDPKKENHVIISVNKGTGIRRSGAGDVEEHSVHQDHLTDKYDNWGALHEGKMSELDYDMKNLDNGNFKKKYGKQKEVVRSNLSNKPVTEEDLSDASVREQGTDSLVNIYKQMTPGQEGNINSAFSSVFKEEVVAADRKPLIVRGFKKEIVNPETGERRQVDIKAHTKTTPSRRVIIKSGNISDGKPPV